MNQDRPLFVYNSLPTVENPGIISPLSFHISLDLWPTRGYSVPTYIAESILLYLATLHISKQLQHQNGVKLQ